MRRPPLRAAFAAMMFALTAPGAALAESYQPMQQVQGDVRIWGSPEDATLIALWGEGFRKFHPQARVVASLHGPESAMAGLYTDVADLALVGRELRQPVDAMAFEWVKLHKPETLEIANASLAMPRVAAGLAVFVHPDNPLAGLTLAQLDAIYGAESRRGTASVHTWGELGLGGEWHDRPIHVLAPPVDSIPALYFRRTVMKDSFKWTPGLKEVASTQQAFDELARDPGAILYAPLYAAGASVKPVPLAVAAGAAFVPLTPATEADRSYPMARAVHIVFDRAPGKPVDPRVREFLRFVLSDQGQDAVARDGAYIPLQPRSVRQQLTKLD